ncbi:MAG TPA: radical SAM protein [Bacillota bacterium]|nr:radical SAM protein [Bacillota bacterium]
MAKAERIVTLSEHARVVHKGEDALMHNLANGSWCRVSSTAAQFFGREGGLDLTMEAASLEGKDAVGMLRLAAELAETGILVDKQTTISKEARRLRKAYLIVTRRCNLGCPSCYMGDSSEGVHDTGKVIEAVEKLKSLEPSRLYITGGEPCLRDDLDKILEAARGMETVLCTNGTLPDRIPFDAMLASRVKLQISLESCNAAEHDFIRGNGTHALSVGSARRAAEMGIEVEIVPTLTPKGGMDISEMVKFAGSLGTGCHGSLLTHVGRGKTAEHEHGVGILKMMLRHLATCLKRGEIKQSAVLEDIMPMLSKSSCGAGKMVVSCTQDARLHPCHLLWDMPLENFDVGYDVDHDVQCKECDVRYLCGGGCRAAAMSNGGHDPNCGVYKSVYTAFAWEWDDSTSVEENLGRLTQYADKSIGDGIGSIQGMDKKYNGQCVNA